MIYHQNLGCPIFRQTHISSLAAPPSSHAEHGSSHQPLHLSRSMTLDRNPSQTLVQTKVS